MSDESIQVNSNDLAFRMGQIQADIKHILSGMHETNTQFKDIDKRFDRMDERLGVVEKFNVKVLAIATLVLPVVTFAGNYLLKKIGV